MSHYRVAQKLDMEGPADYISTRVRGLLMRSSGLSINPEVHSDQLYGG